MNPSPPIRVVVVEDDRRYRTTLQTLLEYEPAFGSCDAFDRPGPVVDAIESGRPLPWDLVVLDIDLPELDGIEAGRRIKAVAPALPVVHLTVFDEPATILRAICAGADGYLLKSTPADELVDQLVAVTQGGSPLTPGVARTILGWVRSSAPPVDRVAPPPPALALSDREQDVLRDLARGLVCKQIADQRGISIHTVRTYVRRIYEKLRVDTIAEAVAVAIRSGLV